MIDYFKNIKLKERCIEKEYLVVWSGGLDSTAIIKNYLEKGYTFNTVYFQLENNELKSKMELKRRKSIKRLLERNFDYKFDDKVITIPKIIPLHNTIINFYQPHLWILGLVYTLQKHRRYEKVSFGYIKHDDFWHVKNSIIESYQALLDTCAIDDNIKTPSLHYPFEWKTKDNILDEFYNDNLGRQLLPLIWTCENVIPKRKTGILCGNCKPCKQFAESTKEFYIKYIEDLNYEYKQAIKPKKDVKSVDDLDKLLTSLISTVEMIKD